MNDTVFMGPKTSYSAIIPYPYFSATSLISNSTWIFLYYQLNETFMGEIVYNTINDKWGSQSTHIQIF